MKITYVIFQTTFICSVVGIHLNMIATIVFNTYIEYNFKSKFTCTVIK